MREEIRIELEKRGIKHKWIYEHIGVSKSHFSHWLRGDRELARKHVQEIICLLEMGEYTHSNMN